MGEGERQHPVPFARLQTRFRTGFGLPLLMVLTCKDLTIVVHGGVTTGYRRSSSEEENKQNTTAGSPQNSSFKIHSAALQLLPAVTQRLSLVS